MEFTEGLKFFHEDGSGFDLGIVNDAEVVEYGEKEGSGKGEDEADEEEDGQGDYEESVDEVKDHVGISCVWIFLGVDREDGGIWTGYMETPCEYRRGMDFCFHGGVC